ncbi:MAG: phosphate/phosphite/phosphonate ABC transporter substrate-binding protein [Clostridia bacterium]|nr:phosphate/phosphite/phosphonate ABC transporter substrate-binding protein [Clostridia bacterium]
MIKRLKCFILIVSLSLFITGCAKPVKKLVIGMIPYNASSSVTASFEPVKEYLQKEIGTEIEILVADTYYDLVQAMKNNKADIGYFGPFSYIAAEKVMKLEPLVVKSRKNTGIFYKSMIVSRSSSDIKSIEDLKGKKFAFVDQGSTSGFVIPYSLFRSRGIDPFNYLGSIKYSGSHDLVALDVLNNVADAGAMNNTTFDKMVSAGKIEKDALKILWQSDPIPGSPFVASPKLDRGLKQKFTAAMLSFHEKDPKAAAKSDSSMEKYVVCDSQMYNCIRNIAKILGDAYVIEKFLKEK